MSKANVFRDRLCSIVINPDNSRLNGPYKDKYIISYRLLTRSISSLCTTLLAVCIEFHKDLCIDTNNIWIESIDRELKYYVNKFENIGGRVMVNYRRYNNILNTLFGSFYHTDLIESYDTLNESIVKEVTREVDSIVSEMQRISDSSYHSNDDHHSECHSS